MDDFEEFYLATKDRVYRTVLAAAGEHPQAEDAVAEAFARALERWPRVSAHPNPAGWVMLTALNHTRSWWRLRRREAPVEDLRRYDESTADPPDALTAAVRDAVRTLPRRQREVVALRLVADLSAEETGALLGITAATVHVHLHRALQSLRATVGEDREAV
jgi:RNA polymerase sigma-70 factor (ECF subfamily)